MILKLTNIKYLLFIFLWATYLIYFYFCLNLNWFNFHHDTALFGTSVIKSYLSDNYQFFLYSHIFLRNGDWEFHTHGFFYQFLFGKLLSCQTWQALFAATYAVYLIFYLPLSLFLAIVMAVSG